MNTIHIFESIECGRTGLIDSFHEEYSLPLALFAAYIATLPNKEAVNEDGFDLVDHTEEWCDANDREDLVSVFILAVNDDCGVNHIDDILKALQEDASHVCFGEESAVGWARTLNKAKLATARLDYSIDAVDDWED